MCIDTVNSRCVEALCFDPGVARGSGLPLVPRRGRRGGSLSGPRGGASGAPANAGTGAPRGNGEGKMNEISGD